MNTQRDLRLLSVAHAISAVASFEDACGVAAERLALALGRACVIREYSGAVWRPVAVSAGTATAVEVENSVSIALGGVGGRQLELLVEAPEERRRDLLAEQGFVDVLGGMITDALELASLRAGRPADSGQEHRQMMFARDLVEILDSATMHRTIVERMARAVNADIGVIAVFLPGEDALAVTATFGYPSVVVEHVRVSSGEGVLGRVFATGQPLLVKDRSAITRRAKRLRYRTDSYAALPLKSAEGVLAVVAFTDKADGSRFDEQDLAELSAMAVPATLALGREQLRDRTKDLAHLATVDGLTGLFNRRYFETRLEQEIQRQRRQFDELALLMVDLDNFKELNDTQGHLVGDRVLREVAEILRRAVRIFDVCARYGGEEFVILMPGASAQTAVRIAERIRRQVEQHFTSGLRPGTPIPLTVSVGVSTASPTTSRETLIGQADSALLWAKSSGKNVVNVYPALTTS